MSEQAPPQPSAIERHAQTLIGVVITGLIFWMGVTIQDQSTTLAGMRAELNGMQAQLSLYAQQTQDRYTASRASTDFAARDQVIADLRERVLMLEQGRRRGND
jgi:Tfp pilus assembly protein PilV